MWRRWMVGVGLIGALACAGMGAAVAERWADTFESAAALGVSYSDITDAETNATCGVASGWGVRTTGTTSQKYYGTFLYAPGSPAIVSEYLRVRFTLDHASTAESGYGNSLFELRGATNNWFVSLYHGVGAGADRSVLEAYSVAESMSTPVATSSTGVIVPASWQTIEMEVWFSTDDGFGGPNSDGRIRVTVDSLEVINATGIMVQSTGGFPNATASVLFGPMGNGDNIGIYDTPAGTNWVDIADFVNVPVNSAHFPGGRARVLCELWTGAGSPAATIQARLYNAEDDVSVGESVEVTSETPVTADFPVTLTAGTRRYRAQVTSVPSGVELFYAGAGIMP